MSGIRSYSCWGSLQSTSLANCISLNGSHVQNPFLLRREVQRICGTVFSVDLKENENGTQLDLTQHVSDHDLFRAFMILAVGSVVPYRNGVIEHHPYGFYLSAMKYLGDGILSKGLESIQDLLLVGRFAIYHHIGTNILLVGLKVKC